MFSCSDNVSKKFTKIIDGESVAAPKNNKRKIDTAAPKNNAKRQKKENDKHTKSAPATL